MPSQKGMEGSRFCLPGRKVFMMCKTDHENWRQKAKSLLQRNEKGLKSLLGEQYETWLDEVLPNEKLLMPTCINSFVESEEILNKLIRTEDEAYPPIPNRRSGAPTSQEFT
eukprot:TRINITY_DN6179_c0_g1_i5.p1 TRINITY_DN6179_c0_g1~~TRINITY_DN6179_c0_g1_i5.p1  ORF type:complete len:111 (-),score=15.25 TRINITY_DN6179_c0_g1_i5:162-494(-)